MKNETSEVFLPENETGQEENNLKSIEETEKQPKNIIVEPIKIEKEQPPQEKPIKTIEKLTITTSFIGQEAYHLKNIIAGRIQAGVTRDNSHFLRQCVDFTINSGFVFKEKRFGLPENTPKLILKDAFFKKSNQ